MRTTQFEEQPSVEPEESDETIFGPVTIWQGTAR